MAPSTNAPRPGTRARDAGRSRPCEPPALVGLLLLVALVLLPVGVEGQQETRRALDHSDYDRWNRIQEEEISADGRWLLYRLVPGRGDGTLQLRAVEGEAMLEVPRGIGAEFSRDSRFAVVRIAPMDSVTRAARAARTRAEAMPKDSLGIVALDGSGTPRVLARIPRVKSWALAEEGNGVLVYHLEPDAPAPRDSSAAPAARQAEGQDDEGKEVGTTLVLRQLASGDETRFASVSDYALSRDGSTLVFSTSTPEGEGDGVFAVPTSAGTTRSLLTGAGVYRDLTLDRDGDQVAFLTNRDSWGGEEEDRVWALYAGGTDEGAPRLLATLGTEGLPAGWIVSEHESPRFSTDGGRLFFGSAPRPAPAPTDTVPESERVRVDVWNWKDPLIQPMQLVQADDERNRTYQAVVHLGPDEVVQLADGELPDVQPGSHTTASHLLGLSNLPYRTLISWDGTYNDVYLVDVETGERRLVVERVRGRASLSPEGRWVTWWDGEERAWFSLDPQTGTVTNISQAIPHPVHNELDDSPAPPGSYGTGGWTADDRDLLLYDAHDVWLVDPAGRRAARNLTEGVGREEDLRFRVLRPGAGSDEDRTVPMDEPVLLSAFHVDTKADGFYRDRFDGTREPERLILEDRAFSTPIKAEDADVYVVTRSTFEEFPDLHVVDPDFRTFRRMSDANPQQSEARWGTAELVSWTSADGIPLQGILYKPDGFDPSRQYPMMVYFYERNSDGLHGYTIPAAGSSSINRSFYVSRGYLLFVPDIPYKLGYPGESAMNAVVPGVLSLLDEGFVDRDRIGVQGHSWGGYQIAYMITRTNLFRAAEAGAPVVNMTSAYGGIRWQTGMVRQFQYEQTQSRIGGTLWNAQQRYIENSPLFTADKVETPVLMLHNDEDGAVPWYQGIEFYAALRRLGKPVWMLNYNGEGHGLGREPNRRDFAIRMQQFFDHYLMDAPAPVWMEYGVPAVDKGRTMGLDLVEPATNTQGNGSGGSGSRD